jgi:hypothetical protein
MAADEAGATHIYGVLSTSVVNSASPNCAAKRQFVSALVSGAVDILRVIRSVPVGRSFASDRSVPKDFQFNSRTAAVGVDLRRLLPLDCSNRI